MKYALFALILTVCLVGCKKENSWESHQESIGKKKYSQVPWDDKNGDITDELYIGTDTAEEIASLLFYCVIPNEMNSTHSYISIIEDEDIIIVSRVPNNGSAGGGYSMAINQKTGEVLKIWAEE